MYDMLKTWKAAFSHPQYYKLVPKEKTEYTKDKLVNLSYGQIDRDLRKHTFLLSLSVVAKCLRCLVNIVSKE